MKLALKNDQENSVSTLQEISQEEEEADLLTLQTTWDEDRAAKPKAVLCLLDQVFQFDMRNSSTSSNLFFYAQSPSMVISGRQFQVRKIDEM